MRTTARRWMRPAGWIGGALVLAIAGGCSRPRGGADLQPSAATTQSPPQAQRSSSSQAPAEPNQTDYAAPDPNGWGSAAGLRFLELHLGGAGRDARVPLLVMIHGMGDRPQPSWMDGFSFAQPVRVIMPEAPFPYHGGFSWFTYRADGQNPPARLAQGIAAAAERVARLMEVVRVRRPTAGTPIVSGFSQGGMLSFALALRHGARITLAVPISGSLPPPLWPSAAANAGAGAPPIRALHGTLDRLVPIATTRELTAHLRGLGYDAQLEEFDGVGHSITPAMARSIDATLSAALAGEAAR